MNEVLESQFNFYMLYYRPASICMVLSEKPTVCPESSDPSEKIFNIFASENEVYTIY